MSVEKPLSSRKIELLKEIEKAKNNIRVATNSFYPRLETISNDYLRDIRRKAMDTYGLIDYNKLPDIIELEFAKFPKGEEYCIHCKNRIEIEHWYLSPCLCYDCKSTPEKPSKGWRKADMRKWNKSKKALVLEKLYLKKVDLILTKRRRWSTFWIIVAIIFTFLFLNSKYVQV